jgi:hypoxanthine phosphoribosyltransferase
MTNKIYLTDTDVKNYTLGIIQQMVQEKYKPDVVLGFARGGLVLANYISQFYNIPMVAINKDTPFAIRVDYDNVLVVDDINDIIDELKDSVTTRNNKYFVNELKFNNLMMNYNDIIINLKAIIKNDPM